MGFVVKIVPQDHTDISGYYLGGITYYSHEHVNVPNHTDDLKLAKVYKHRKTASNAATRIVSKSSFVRECVIEEI